MDYFKDIPVRTEIIKLSWIPDSDLLLYIRNDTNYNTLQTIEILDTVTGQIKVVDTGEVWQIRTTWDMTSTAPPFYQPGSDTYLEVKYKDYSDDTDNEIWNYYLDFDDLADIYEKYGGVREFDFSTILNRMYVEFSAPRCSPNGKYIVYSAKLERTSAPGLDTPLWVAAAIWLYDIESEETHIIYKQEDEASIGRVDWINDSELCFVTYYDWQGSRDNINYYSIETGKSEVLFHYSEEHYNNVTLLPIGNQKITFTSSANDCFYYESLTYVIDIGTREVSALNVSYDDKSILLENFIYYIENSENTASSESEEVNKADTFINSDALHFLLYAGEGEVSDSTTTAEIAEMRTDAFAAEWKISEGSLSVSESPVMTVSGITGQDVIKNWNGSNEYYITDMNMVTSVEGSDKTLIQYIYSEDSTAYYTSDYSLYLSLEDHSITVKSNDACMVFDKTEKEFLLNGEKLSSNNFLMLTPEFDRSENIIYVPFIYPSPAQIENLSDYVVILSLDMTTNELMWSEPKVIPHEYMAGIIFSLSNCATVNGKLYFSTWKEAAYYDIKKGDFVHLGEPFQKIDELLGDKASRSGFFGGIIPTSVIGCSGDIVALSLDYTSLQSPDTSYCVQIAVRDDKMLGAVIYEFSNSSVMCSVYDKNMNIVNQYDLSKYHFRAALFQTARDGFIG